MARGRKRKTGAREPNGRLQRKPAIDKGTPELQSRRKFDAGNGDHALTWNLVGILRANGQITEQQLMAAREYRRLYCVVYKRPDVSAAPLDGIDRGPPIEPDEAEILGCKLDLARMEMALSRLSSELGRRIKDVFDNVVIFDRRPRWMCAMFPRESDIRDARLFLRAIQAVSGDKSDQSMAA